MYKIILAYEAHNNSVNALYNSAKEYFKANNIDQWQNGYPNEESFLSDVKNGESYIVLNDNDIIATFMFSQKIEPTYAEIYNGEWEISGEYAVMHRIAVAPGLKGCGIMAQIVSFASDKAKKNGKSALRCDTHADNKSMQRALIKNGFHYSGIIYLDSANSDERYAYEKKI